MDSLSECESGNSDSNNTDSDVDDDNNNYYVNIAFLSK